MSSPAPHGDPSRGPQLQSSPEPVIGFVRVSTWDVSLGPGRSCSATCFMAQDAMAAAVRALPGLDV